MKVNEVLKSVIEACEERKAEDCIIMKMEDITPIADYFVICHGNNERQVQAIARAIEQSLNKAEVQLKRMEGFEQARWILIDTGDIICHIFHKDERNYYNLERLWGDAKRVPIEDIE